MSDQCEHCTAKGDMSACVVLDCGHHKTWYAKELMARLSDAEDEIDRLREACKNNAKEIADLERYAREEVRDAIGEAVMYERYGDGR